MGKRKPQLWTEEKLTDYYAEHGTIGAKRALEVFKKAKTLGRLELSKAVWPAFKIVTSKGEIMGIREGKEPFKSHPYYRVRIHYTKLEENFDFESKKLLDENLVKSIGKLKYTTGDNSGDIASLNDDIDFHAFLTALDGLGDITGASIEQKTIIDEKVPVSILTRRGQPTFRKALLKAYNSRCAITGCDVEAALEAAHIIPHPESNSYDVTNGILLRADIHTLFDLHKLSIDPSKWAVVLGNGLTEHYKAINGTLIALPIHACDQPNTEALLEHFKKWKAQNG